MGQSSITIQIRDARLVHPSWLCFDLPQSGWLGLDIPDRFLICMFFTWKDPSIIQFYRDIWSSGSWALIYVWHSWVELREKRVLSPWINNCKAQLLDETFSSRPWAIYTMASCHPCAVAMLCLVHATTSQLLSFWNPQQLVERIMNRTPPRSSLRNFTKAQPQIMAS